MSEIYCIKCKKYKGLKSLKYHIFAIKHYFFLVFVIKCGSEDEQIFMEEESIKILKIIGLITNIEEYQKIYNHA